MRDRTLHNLAGTCAMIARLSDMNPETSDEAQMIEQAWAAAQEAKCLSVDLIARMSGIDADIIHDICDTSIKSLGPPELPDRLAIFSMTYAAALKRLIDARIISAMMDAYTDKYQT